MKVIHDSRRHRFTMKLGAYEASLMYARRGKTLDFYHIYVPDPFRNRGHAARLLIAAFEFAKRRHYRVIPTCPFIRNDFLPRFPQYQPLVQAGEFPFV
jgi:hypothetical protein